MALTTAQWVRLIFVDAPEFKRDLDTMTVIALAKKWLPRVRVYGFVPDEEAVTPHEAVRRISEGAMTREEKALIDRIPIE